MQSEIEEVCVCVCVCVPSMYVCLHISAPLSDWMTQKQARQCTPTLTSTPCSSINRKCRLDASSSQVTTTEYITHSDTQTLSLSHTHTHTHTHTHRCTLWIYTQAFQWCVHGGGWCFCLAVSAKVYLCLCPNFRASFLPWSHSFCLPPQVRRSTSQMTLYSNYVPCNQVPIQYTQVPPILCPRHPVVHTSVHLVNAPLVRTHRIHQR